MPTPKQSLALSHHQVRRLLYGGAAGGGKSDFLLMAASLHCANPDSHALLIRRTYNDLRQAGGLMDRAIQWWAGKPGIRWVASDRKFIFPSGATITFGHCENSSAHHHYQGGEYTFIGIDEASLLPEEQLRWFETRIRSSSPTAPPTQYRLASNPGGISHYYLRDNYVGTDDPNTLFIPADRRDNHALPEDYERQFDNLDPHTRAQLLHGDWDSEPSGGFFEFPSDDELYVAYTPDSGEPVRSWDLAATSVSRGKDPDYTVGVKMYLVDGVYYLDDIVRFREEPAATESRIRNTADLDGPNTRILIEQEPGSSGKTASSHLTRNVLSDRSVFTIRPTGSKQSRARLLASHIRNGNFRIRRAKWNAAFLSELQGFPKGAHDDQVDAVSQALGHLNDRSKIHIIIAKDGHHEVF